MERSRLLIVPWPSVLPGISSACQRRTRVTSRLRPGRQPCVLISFRFMTMLSRVVTEGGSMDRGDLVHPPIIIRVAGEVSLF